MKYSEISTTEAHTNAMECITPDQIEADMRANAKPGRFVPNPYSAPGDFLTRDSLAAAVNLGQRASGCDDTGK